VTNFTVASPLTSGCAMTATVTVAVVTG